MMVGNSSGKMIENSRWWPCGVCGKGGQANSGKCTVCIKRIHKRCSGVRGDLSRVSDSFRCRRCDEIIQEADSGGIARFTRVLFELPCYSQFELEIQIVELSYFTNILIR